MVVTCTSPAQVSRWAAVCPPCLIISQAAFVLPFTSNQGISLMTMQIMLSVNSFQVTLPSKHLLKPEAFDLFVWEALS